MKFTTDTHSAASTRTQKLRPLAQSCMRNRGHRCRFQHQAKHGIIYLGRKSQAKSLPKTGQRGWLRISAKWNSRCGCPLSRITHNLLARQPTKASRGGALGLARWRAMHRAHTLSTAASRHSASGAWVSRFPQPGARDSVARCPPLPALLGASAGLRAVFYFVTRHLVSNETHVGPVGAGRRADPKLESGFGFGWNEEPPLPCLLKVLGRVRARSAGLRAWRPPPFPRHVLAPALAAARSGR